MTLQIHLGNLEGLKRSIQTTENLINCVIDLETKKILSESARKLRKRQDEIRDELQQKGHVL